AARRAHPVGHRLLAALRTGNEVRGGHLVMMRAPLVPLHAGGLTLRDGHGFDSLNDLRSDEAPSRADTRRSGARTIEGGRAESSAESAGADFAIALQFRQLSALTGVPTPPPRSGAA